MQGHNTMRSKLSIRVFVNDKQAYNFNFYILQDLTQIQVQIAGQIDVLYRNLFSVALSFLALGNSKRVWFKVNGPKGESGRSSKWTVARKWTVHPKVDELEPN